MSAISNEAASLAALNVTLLQAIQAGGATSPSDLAERAAILANHVHRKLDSLEAAGLIVRVEGSPKHEATLTPDGLVALNAMAVFRGEVAAGGGPTMIPFDKIIPWAGNPRTFFDPKTTEDLAVNVGDKGVLQAIVVRATADGLYEVIIGERRRRASALAVQRGLAPPTFCIPCDIRDVSDDEAEEIAGVENIQREDMHWMDLAEYFRKQMDDRRKSGPTLSRLFGRKWSARKIQDYAKIARELPTDVKALAYLPDKLGGDEDGKPNPDCLVYTKARDMVGEKKEKPALDLTPKAAMTLLEMIDAGNYAHGVREIVVTFATAPVGGPIATLAERKLINWRFPNGKPGAAIPIGDEVQKWLDDLSYPQNAEAALFRLRAAVVGDLQANTLRIGEYVTEELNRRAEPVGEPAAATDMAQTETLDAMVMTPAEARDAMRPDVEDHSAAEIETGESLVGDGEQAEGEEPIPEYLRRLAGPAAPAAAPPILPTNVATPKALPPMLAIVVLEVAHRLARDGIERGPGTWGSEVLVTYYKDARGGQLVQQHKMLAFLPYGVKNLVALTKGARDWLWETHGLRDEGGKPIVGDVDLRGAQASYGIPPVGDGPYSTFWLNPPLEIEAVAPVIEDGGEPMELGEHLTVTLPDADQRAVSALAAAAGQAAKLLAKLRGRTKPPKAEDTDPTIALLEAAIEAVQPLIAGSVDVG